MSGGEHEREEVPRGLSLRRATYAFGPLRNALAAGLPLGAGLLAELLDGPEALAVAAFLVSIPVGAWYFAQEGWEELLEEREVGIEARWAPAAPTPRSRLPMLR